jgi:hypothetical protein
MENPKRAVGAGAPASALAALEQAQGQQLV